MPITVDAKELAGRFLELVTLIGRGVEVMVHDGDVVMQLVPPVPPLSTPREHTFEVLSNGTAVRGDFNAPMELVDSAEVREWETLAEWVRALRKSDTTTLTPDSQPSSE